MTDFNEIHVTNEHIPICNESIDFLIDGGLDEDSAYKRVFDNYVKFKDKEPLCVAVLTRIL